jgi:hypothetical protein
VHASAQVSQQALSLLVSRWQWHTVLGVSVMFLRPLKQMTALLFNTLKQNSSK